jgi:hypothetical protein
LLPINENYGINIKRYCPEYLITDAKQLMLYRFLINYDAKLYNGWINGNLTVNDGINIWKVTFKTYDCYKYDE